MITTIKETPSATAGVQLRATPSVSTCSTTSAAVCAADIAGAAMGTAPADGKIWRAALYLRISKEDGDKEESESITNQRGLLLSHAQKLHDVTVISEKIEACDIIEPNPRSLATSGFQGIWFILYYA